MFIIHQKFNTGILAATLVARLGAINIKQISRGSAAKLVPAGALNDIVLAAVR